MNVLLIGATGQIGYALANALAETEHWTTVLVRDGRKVVFPPNVSVVEAPVFAEEMFARVLGGAECVIYGVGLPEQFAFDAGVFREVNYGILERFLRALRSAGGRRLVYVSTYEVFQAIGGMIRETHPLAETQGMSPYFRAMTEAYWMVKGFAAETGVALTTIHPAAVYGGLNTGDGFTNFLENLLERRFWRAPVILPGRFPVVHAESLAGAMVRALGRPGAFIVSDQMTSLGEMAQTLRGQARSYVPLTVPAWLACASTAVIERAARVVRRRPIMARAQLDFITQGYEPSAEKAGAELGWRPMGLDEGVRRYLRTRGVRW